MAARRRLDTELVRRGLAPSRARAADLIDDRRVLVAGAVATKAARLVDPGDAVEVTGPPPRFVGRGGEKLDAALSAFSIDVSGRRCLDAGSSTGGFTDCLLQRGAAHVVAVDVGRGQLDQRLRDDPRVDARERTDIRSIDPGSVGGALEVVVADLSFIPLEAVLDPVLALARPGAALVVLVKPQFEAGRPEVSRGRGVVRDPEVWHRVLTSALGALSGRGAAIMGAMPSPLRGAAGNVEFLVHACAPGGPARPDGPDRAALVDRAVRSVEQA